MHITESITSSIQTIFSHKFRSFLTLIGILIGVASVVTMFALIDSYKKILKEGIESMGWENAIQIQTDDGSSSNIGNRRKNRNFYYMNRKKNNISIDDYFAIKGNVDAKYCYGVINEWERLKKHSWVMVKATNVDYFKSMKFTIKHGRYFNHYEESKGEKICLIGDLFAKKKFPNENPVGQQITVGKYRFKIIGILTDPQRESKRMFGGWQRDWQLTHNVFIPLGLGSKYFRGNGKIDNIYVQANSMKEYSQLKNKIRQIMLAQHNMAHDFQFEDLASESQKITSEMDTMMKKWNITLSAIASISLIVGGIGLFSTLLISIAERLKEIGIRKSIGATDLDIFIYFIIEALILALLGAIGGLILSKILTISAEHLIKIDVPIPVKGVFTGIGFSLGVGFLSGLYPAIKASMIDPIKAIFYFE